MPFIKRLTPIIERAIFKGPDYFRRQTIGRITQERLQKDPKFKTQHAQLRQHAQTEHLTKQQVDQQFFQLLDQSIQRAKTKR